MPEPTLRESIRGISDQIGISADKIIASLGGLPFDSYTKAVTDPREQVFVVYTIGGPDETINGRTGGVSFKTYDVDGQKVRYGLVNKNNYKLDGTYDGTNQVVTLPFAPPYTPGPEDPPPPQESYRRPNEFTGPWGPEEGPWSLGVPDDVRAPRSSFKAVWTFADAQKSSIYAAGLMQFLLVPLKPAKTVKRKKAWSQLFQLSISAIISGGTGKYAGATGVTSTNASAFVPPGVDFFTLPDDQFVPGVSVEIFRVILAKDWDPAEAKKRGGY